MAKRGGWGKGAGIQGAVVVRRTLPGRLPGLRGATPGMDPDGSAATVGLVSPPGGIVLWDEWRVARKKKRNGNDPQGPGKAHTLADKRWRPPAKEVRGDRNKR
jgi:hypothetical protein